MHTLLLLLASIDTSSMHNSTTLICIIWYDTPLVHSMHTIDTLVVCINNTTTS